MQPNSSAQQKLAQLPQPALEALLDSDDLKVASENSAIAAVTFWLGQGDRAAQLTKEQKQRLAYKLRLLRATPWYLTRVLADENHWLYAALTGVQRVMLTAAVQNPRGWGPMEGKDAGNGLRAKLFGNEGAPEVSWSQQQRAASSVMMAEVSVEASLVGIWGQGKGGFVIGAGYFYNGTVWAVKVRLQRESAAVNPLVGFQLGAFMVHNCINQPVAFSADFKVLGAEDKHTVTRTFNDTVLCADYTEWGFSDMCNCKFTSLEDGTTKLARFIHSDGKLHVKASVSEVQ